MLRLPGRLVGGAALVAALSSLARLGRLERLGSLTSLGSLGSLGPVACGLLAERALQLGQVAAALQVWRFR